MNKFEVGKFVVTRGVANAVAENNADFVHFVNESHYRYMACDWGEMCEEDKAENDKAVEQGDLRIFASYTYPETGDVIWIITEADRSYTTILFPDEY